MRAAGICRRAAGLHHEAEHGEADRLRIVSSRNTSEKLITIASRRAISDICLSVKAFVAAYGKSSRLHWGCGSAVTAISTSRRL